MSRFLVHSPRCEILHSLHQGVVYLLSHAEDVLEDGLGEVVLLPCLVGQPLPGVVLGPLEDGLAPRTNLS